MNFLDYFDHRFRGRDTSTQDQGMARPTNECWNFQTDPNKGLDNQYVMQMMDAKMGKASSIYSNMNRKN